MTPGRDYWLVFWPLNTALTLPWFGKPVVFCSVGLWDRLRLHEECHCEQLRRWGAWGYLWRHLKARLRSRSLYAVNEPVERECYEAQRRAAQKGP